MRTLGALFLVVAVSTACGGGGDGSAPPPRTPEAAVAQDPSRPNTVYGIEGTVDGAPEVGLSDGREVMLDGAKIGDADPKKKSDALGRALQQKKSASGRVAYAFEPDTQWAVVRGLLDTAAKAGYPHASFVTRVVREGNVRPSHLDVEVATEKKTTPDRELHVNLSSRGAVMLRWLEGTKQVGDVVPTDAVVNRLATPIEHEWNARGLFHEPNALRFDQVVLHVEPDTPYIVVVTVLDAISATKRGTVPAFVVNLPADDKAPERTIGAPSSKPR